MKAIWKDKVIAESDDIVRVENSKYFPPEAVKMEYLRPSGTTYQCHWKGTADYYDVVVDGEVNKEAAFVYQNPTEPAKSIAGRFAFWRGVEVTD